MNLNEFETNSLNKFERKHNLNSSTNKLVYPKNTNFQPQFNINLNLTDLNKNLQLNLNLTKLN